MTPDFSAPPLSSRSARVAVEEYFSRVSGQSRSWPLVTPDFSARGRHLILHQIIRRQGAKFRTGVKFRPGQGS